MEFAKYRIIYGYFIEFAEPSLGWMCRFIRPRQTFLFLLAGIM
jgi:hypothetical protein